MFSAQASFEHAVGLRIGGRGRHRQIAAQWVRHAMPGKNGAEVARQVHPKRPTLPIILLTGYVDATALGDVGEDSATAISDPAPMSPFFWAIDETLVTAQTADGDRREAMTVSAGTCGQEPHERGHGARRRFRGRRRH